MWLLYGIIAIILWSFLNICDGILVEELYDDEYDGIFSSAILNIPVILFLSFFVRFSEISQLTFLIGALSGFLFMAAFLFYFRALNEYNDSSLMQVFFNLNTPIILTLSSLPWLLGEKLTFLELTSICIVFLSSTFIFLSKDLMKVVGRKYFWKMIVPAVFLMSLGEVGSRFVYEIKGLFFWEGTFLFLIGQLIFGFLLFFSSELDSQKLRKVRKMKSLVTNLKIIFVESIELIATICFQKAVESSKGLAFYSAIECLMPLTVLFLGLVISLVLRKFDGLSVSDSFEDLFINYKRGFSIKVLCTMVTFLGIYLII